jgi:pimeloyl-ACP methyl ester carboxylesterase
VVRTGLMVLGGALVGTLALTPPAGHTATVAARAGLPSCAAPTSTGAAKGMEIADPSCDYDYVSNTYGGSFGPLLDSSGKASSTTYVGISAQASYRIEVPNHWNGQLLLYAHPYQGLGNVAWVDSPQLRSWFVANGFAWAASSFAASGYDVAQGVADTFDLLKVFAARTHRAPKSIYLDGESMGGQVASVTAEEHRGVFAGVMDACAPVSVAALSDYYLGVNATAAALTKTGISFPTQASLASALQYEVSVTTQVLPGLGTGSVGAAGSELSAAGKQWATAVSYLSGGPRPGFASALAYWNSVSYGPLTGMPTLFDLYPGLDGGTLGFAPGNVTTNLGVVYHADSSSVATTADRALNADVLRVRATTSSVPGAPSVQGDPAIPVLALYGTGDLFVPLSTGQAYARAMAAHGESGLFAARAIRDVRHCDFSTAELSQGFSALVSWAQTGIRPASDDISNPEVVGRASFGCRFTDGAHPLFQGPPCPKEDLGS